MIFLDTSAIYALADVDDANHEKAIALFDAVQNTEEQLLTSSYVLVESAALLQRRLGHNSALAFLRDAADFEVHWVTPEIHTDAVSRLGTPGNSTLSLVDAVSFVVMRLHGTNTYLGFDRHFEAEGFHRVPNN
jgi:uncharacterized protein